MPLTANVVELIAQWCAQSEAIDDIRAKARSDFFGYDEPGTIKYMAGSEELNTRERRFLGWFSFVFRLPDGRRPAETAATALLKGTELSSALKSIQNARYVLAIVTMVMPNKAVYLELEDEEFDVSSRYMSHILYTEDSVCAHILPVGRNRWVIGPGWLTWPVRFGPGMRSRLKKFQPSPIEVERFLQQRSSGKEKPKIDYPRDKTLKEAVTRMTEAAHDGGKDQLIRSLEEWKGIVLACMKANDFNRFHKDIAKWVGKFSSLDELNKWIALASNIWNNVPQPDRGNRSAVEIIAEERQRGEGPAD